VRDDPKPGENKNVHFWVSEKSEKVLVENRVPSSFRFKESGV
jgi:hypothetical protein